MQPVLLQSFCDEFELPDGETPATPAAPGSALQPGEDGNELEYAEQKKHRSRVSKLLHMMKWMQPEILNPVHELSHFMMMAAVKHM